MRAGRGGCLGAWPGHRDVREVGQAGAGRGLAEEAADVRGERLPGVKHSPGLKASARSGLERKRLRNQHGRSAPLDALKLRILENDCPALEVTLTGPLEVGRQGGGEPGPCALLPATAD